MVPPMMLLFEACSLFSLRLSLRPRILLALGTFSCVVLSHFSHVRLFAPQSSTAFAIWTDTKRGESTFRSGEMHPFEDPGQRNIRQEFFCLYLLRCVSALSDSLQHHGLKPARLLCPWDSPGKNPGVGSHALLQGLFPTQG